jgi:hypothetical protein
MRIVMSEPLSRWQKIGGWHQLAAPRRGLHPDQKLGLLDLHRLVAVIHRQAVTVRTPRPVTRGPGSSHPLPTGTVVSGGLAT